MNTGFKTIAFFAFLFSSTTAFSQNCTDQYLGTKTLYEPQQTKYTAPPKGYQAVFINHVGRHGARHLTKDVAISMAYQLLNKADSLKMLTSEGSLLKEKVVKLQQIEKKNLKFISIRGAEEQQEIGKRVMLNYNSVFAKPNGCVNITVTKEERTRQSAEAFLKGLDYKTNCKSDWVTDNDQLRFFSMAPAYKQFEDDGNWKKAYDKLESNIRPASFDKKIVNRFFKNAFSTKLNEEQQTTFVDDIDGLGAITKSIQQEIVNAGYHPLDLDIRGMFSCDELRILSRLGDADDFLKKGPGIDPQGIQVRDAIPLLVSFINTTDAYMVKNGTVANLRFAHAETIAPIAALMDMKGASELTTDVLTFEKVWSAEIIIPLSSNVQWILYKNVAGNYLIKIMLNEKEVAINGVTTKSFPYYEWKDIRQHYINKLIGMHISLKDDMHAYLMALK